MRKYQENCIEGCECKNGHKCVFNQAEFDRAGGKADGLILGEYRCSVCGEEASFPLLVADLRTPEQRAEIEADILVSIELHPWGRIRYYPRSAP